MGKLHDYWREYTKYSDGTGPIINVPNVVEELRIDMGTNVGGSTDIYAIAPGIEAVCNTRNGYNFSSTRTDGSPGNDWCWNKVRNEIDNNRPFLWSVGWYDGGTAHGHSLCAWGYTDAKDVITYNTWNCARDDWHYKDDLYRTGVVDVVPGGWTWGQTSLTAPDGGETWTVGKTYDIRWHEFDERTRSADLYYSTDGGVNWSCFWQVEPSSPGWKSYAWTIPTSVPATTKARIKIKNYSGSSGDWTYQAGDGSEANFTIVRDQTAPTPNPMIWSTEPYEQSTSQIRMYARTASDSFTPIEYYFDFYSSPTGGSGGTDSDWQTSTYYADTGLGPNHRYGYRVKARDGSPDHNQTDYSGVSYDYTDIQTPTGITFGTITSTSIQAKSTNTPSGLTRGNSGLYIYNATAATNSGCKKNNDYWTSGSLSVNTRYGFKAKARNGDSHETVYCPTSYRYTHANTPGKSSFSKVSQTSIRANWTANGNPPGTEYYCENATAGANSGWTTNTYWNSAGLRCGTFYTFRVQAKNGDGIQTGWTKLGSQSTQPCHTTPMVTTTAVSSITSNSASSGGNVTSDGGASVTARGVCWSTSANPTTGDSHTSDGTGPGSFTSRITGLSPNTTYHVRAYATNSVGTGYGSEKTFTTKGGKAMPWLLLLLDD
jgi:hypothetical protein